MTALEGSANQEAYQLQQNLGGGLKLDPRGGILTRGRGVGKMRWGGQPPTPGNSNTEVHYYSKALPTYQDEVGGSTPNPPAIRTLKSTTTQKRSRHITDSVSEFKRQRATGDCT